MLSKHCTSLTVFLTIAVLFNAFANSDGQKGVLAGDLWLRMTPETRLGYAMGYTRGYWMGFGDGCREADRIIQPVSKKVGEQPLHVCTGRAPKFTRNPSIYTDEITKLYTSFPASRRIPWYDIFPLLSDSQKKSAEEIYRIYFPTEQPAKPPA